MSYLGKQVNVKIDRMDDDDDKLIVVPSGQTYRDEQIRSMIDFQEQYFELVIICQPR